MTPTPAGASLPAAACMRSPVRLACLFALVLALALAACTPSADKESGEARYSAQITGYNHTGEYIHRFYLDDVSGGNVFAYTGGGSFVCCIRCPTRWTPGLQIRVRWSTSSSDPDATAEEVWHEAVVPVEQFALPGGVRGISCPARRCASWCRTSWQAMPTIQARRDPWPLRTSSSSCSESADRVHVRPGAHAAAPIPSQRVAARRTRSSRSTSPARTPLMRTFDEQYRFIRMARHDDATPSLKPDPANPWWDDAGDMPANGPPWVFHNVWKMQNRSRKIQEKVAEVLFEGSDLVVSTRIRDALVERGIPDLHTVPAVYVDDHDVRHAGYWYLAFTRRFDCWDRQASTCDGEPIVGAGMEIHDVTKFRLDAALLGRTPLAHRLLFKMGGSQEAFITVHDDLLPVFGDGDALGVEFQRVIDY